LLVAAKNDFRIAMGMKRVARLFELRAKLLKIVDAAVENQPDFTVVGEHRLMAGGTEIDNCQTPVR
jgi:hypothetical protein